MIITYTSDKHTILTRARAVSRRERAGAARDRAPACPRLQTHTHTGRTAPADPRHRRGPTTAHPAVRKA